MITVDNGITARKEVQQLQNEGVRVLITDHHLALDSLQRLLPSIPTIQLVPTRLKNFWLWGGLQISDGFAQSPTRNCLVE